MWRDSFFQGNIAHMCDLTHMCDMVCSCVATAHLCVWHKSFKGVPWRTLARRRIVNNACHTYRDRAKQEIVSFTKHSLFYRALLQKRLVILRSQETEQSKQYRYINEKSSMPLVWRIRMRDMILNMVHSHVWRDFFRGNMAHMCDVNSMCDMTRSHVCHDRLLREVVHLSMCYATFIRPI